MSFHAKYRPTTFKRVLGHASAIATLRGFVERDDIPSAILFTGPPSAGKTTLARVLANETLGEEAMRSCFEEINLASERSIEEIRGLIRLASMRPMSGNRRFIMCDEAHGILQNNPAAQALLKPLEEPIKSTTWLLATMEPEKFMSSTVGRAIASRCVKIKLEAPTEDELVKWRTYKRDKPLKKKSNPRLQLYNWCTKALEFQQARASPKNFRPHDPSKEDWSNEPDYI